MKIKLRLIRNLVRQLLINKDSIKVIEKTLEEENNKANELLWKIKSVLETRNVTDKCN